MTNRYRAAADVIETDLGSELILLDPRSQEMFSLNETGRFLWQRLPEADEEALAGLLAAEYDTEADTARSDVRKVLDDLLTWNLIEPAEVGRGAYPSAENG